MEPVSLLLTAIVSGAAAALEPTTKAAIQDAYQGLKELIKRKWKGISLEQVEQKPQSTTRRDALKDDLEEGKVALDAEVLAKAQELIRAVKEHAPQAAQAAGISLADLEAGGSVNIEDLVAAGAGISVKGVSARDGNITIKGLRSENPPKR